MQRSYQSYPTADGESAHTVCIIALQAPTGDVGMFGIEINVGGSFSTEEARLVLVAASIESAASKIEEIEEAKRQGRW